MQTLCRMDEPEKPAQLQKRAMVMALCILAVLMLASATAVAAGDRWVNWEGKTVPNRTEGYVRDRMNKLINLMDRLPEGQMAVLEANGEEFVCRLVSGKMRFLPKTLLAAERLLANQSVLPWPKMLPEGYFLVSATVTCCGAPDAAYTHIRTEQLDEAAWLHYVGLSEAQRLYTGYQLRLRKLGSGQLDISVELLTSGYGSFRVRDGEQVATLSFPGIEKALVVQSGTSVKVYALKRLPQAVAGSEPIWYKGKVYPNRQQYQVLQYSMEATDLMEQELLAIFGWQKAE